MNDSHKVIEIRFRYSKTDEWEDIKFLVNNNDVETFLSEVKNNGSNLIDRIDYCYCGDTDLEENPEFHIEVVNIFEFSKYDWVGQGSFEEDEPGDTLVITTDVYNYTAKEN